MSLEDKQRPFRRWIALSQGFYLSGLSKTTLTVEGLKILDSLCTRKQIRIQPRWGLTGRWSPFSTPSNSCTVLSITDVQKCSRTSRLNESSIFISALISSLARPPARPPKKPQTKTLQVFSVSLTLSLHHERYPEEEEGNKKRHLFQTCNERCLFTVSTEWWEGVDTGWVAAAYE